MLRSDRDCTAAARFRIIGALLVTPALLAFVPYVIVQREAALRRTLENWTVSASSFLASPSHVQQWLLAILGLRCCVAARGPTASASARTGSR